MKMLIRNLSIVLFLSAYAFTMNGMDAFFKVREIVWKMAGGKTRKDELAAARRYIETQDAQGNTPLHRLAQQKPETLGTTMMAYMSPAERKMRQDEIQQKNAALEKDQINTAINARTTQANLNIQNNQGDTPLIIAAANGHEDMVIILVEGKADVTTKDKLGTTALDYAIRCKYPTIIDKLKSALPATSATAAEKIELKIN